MSSILFKFLNMLEYLMTTCLLRIVLFNLMLGGFDGFDPNFGGLKDQCLKVKW